MLSMYFYHGLNGQLCPEYFQKGPRNFGFWVGASALQLPQFFFKIFVKKKDQMISALYFLRRFYFKA